jgi:hypothetical protein
MQGESQHAAHLGAGLCQVVGRGVNVLQ